MEVLLIFTANGLSFKMPDQRQRKLLTVRHFFIYSLFRYEGFPRLVSVSDPVQKLHEAVADFFSVLVINTGKLLKEIDVEHPVDLRDQRVVFPLHRQLPLTGKFSAVIGDDFGGLQLVIVHAVIFVPEAKFKDKNSPYAYPNSGYYERFLKQ